MRAVRTVLRVKFIALAVAIILLGSIGFSYAAITGQSKDVPTVREDVLPQAVSLKTGAFQLPKIEYNQTQVVVKEIAVKTAQKVEAKQKARQVQAYRTRRSRRARRPVRRSGSEQAQANAILASMIRRYPILRGTYVVFGPTPNGNRYQAVAYYTIGKIVISPSHTASLSSIITHECMHIKDWREDHRINNDDSW